MASPGFTAVDHGIRAAARQADAASEGARALGLGAVATTTTTTTTISQALRGTRSATAAGELSTAWEAAISTWSAEVSTHAQRLTDSATTYATTDAEGADRCRRAGPSKAP